MGKSSKDKRDAYYRLAKEEGWRARSAYKLLQLDEEFDLFKDVTRVVDLCAAPGSWSQVLSRVLIKGEKFGRAGWAQKEAELRHYAFGDPMPVQEPETAKAPRKDVRIVSIDLQPMSPLEGVTTLRADITHPSTIPLLLSALDPNTDTSTPAQSSPVDLVISDGAPDVTGLHDLDIYVQSQLLWAALNLAICVLKPGGKFVAKIFRGKDVDLLFAQLRIMFRKVTVAKPRSSRASSIEAFVVAEDFVGKNPAALEEQKSQALKARRKLETMANSGPRDKQPAGGLSSLKTLTIDLPSDSEETSTEDSEIGGARWIAPFLACGDLSAYDADATYHLPKDRVSLDPVQPPTAPPYRTALEMRKLAGGAYGKTKGSQDV